MAMLGWVADALVRFGLERMVELHGLQSLMAVHKQQEGMVVAERPLMVVKRSVLGESFQICERKAVHCRSRRCTVLGSGELHLR